MNQEFRFSHRIIKPKPYTPSVATDISKTLRDNRMLHAKVLPLIVLRYPIRGK